MYARTVLGFLRHVARESGVVDGRGGALIGPGEGTELQGDRARRQARRPSRMCHNQWYISYHDNNH